MDRRTFLIEKARAYAERCDIETNHLYDGKPYSVHLDMVEEVAKEYMHLIPNKDWPNVLSACRTHDLCEDCRQTYNDVKKELNETVAEIVYAVTNEKGKTRAERANKKYYRGIKGTPYAVFVKLCDRIANMKYSIDKGSDMAKKYAKENDHFVKSLYNFSARNFKILSWIIGLLFIMGVIFLPHDQPLLLIFNMIVGFVSLFFHYYSYKPQNQEKYQIMFDRLNAMAELQNQKEK